MDSALPTSVIVEKPRITTVWLDTCVVSDIVQAQLGTLSGGDETTRAKALDASLTALVMAGRLLCLRADQEEESDAATRIPGLPDAISAKYAQYSMGVRTWSHGRIEREQVLLAMEAYCAKAPCIFLPLESCFREEPVALMDAARRAGFSVTYRLSPDLLKKRRVVARQATFEEVSALRAGLSSSFEEQAVAEEIGLLDAFDVTIDRFRNRQPRDMWEMNQLLAWHPYFEAWAAVGGRPAGEAGLREFFSSSYVRALPINVVRSRLWADVLTGGKPVRPSDSMDIAMLGAVLPISHFVVTDRKMAARIKRRRLDTRWACKVFSLSSIADLIADLGVL
jgi:hypothetical protein